MTTVSVSDVALLLRRRGDFVDFGVGGWTPFSSRVRSAGTFLFRSKYLIKLLFVSAMSNLPETMSNIRFLDYEVKT